MKKVSDSEPGAEMEPGVVDDKREKAHGHTCLITWESELGVEERSLGRKQDRDVGVKRLKVSQEAAQQVV